MYIPCALSQSMLTVPLPGWPHFRGVTSVEGASPFKSEQCNVCRGRDVCEVLGACTHKDRSEQKQTVQSLAQTLSHHTPQINKMTTTSIRDYLNNPWKEGVDKCDKNTKTTLCQEKYLIKMPQSIGIPPLSRFRLSNHSLPIERGSILHIPREENMQ